MIGARDAAAVFDAAAVDTAGLSADQTRAVAGGRGLAVAGAGPHRPGRGGKTTSLRALREAAHGDRPGGGGGPDRAGGRCRPGRGAADTGATVAAALADLREGAGRSDAGTLLLVDEAGMVGTRTGASCWRGHRSRGQETVLVGDAHQLAPVRSRGGMFAELVADLPWAQHLSAVWRMADPAERDASWASATVTGAQLAEAVDWYRDAGPAAHRDPVTMAADALAAWTADQTGWTPC